MHTHIHAHVDTHTHAHSRRAERDAKLRGLDQEQLDAKVVLLATKVALLVGLFKSVGAKGVLPAAPLPLLRQWLWQPWLNANLHPLLAIPTAAPMPLRARSAVLPSTLAVSC